MLINEATLKKICIANGFLDPHVLWEAFGPAAKKKASRLLQDIKASNAGDAGSIEQQTVDLIRKTWENRRYQRRLAFILLMQSQHEGMLSPRAYRGLREEMGVNEISKETEDTLNKGNQNGRDIFQTLQGNPALQDIAAKDETNQIKSQLSNTKGVNK